MLRVERIGNIGNGFDPSGNNGRQKGQRANTSFIIDDACDIDRLSFEDILNSEINRIKETVRNYEQARR